MWGNAMTNKYAKLFEYFRACPELSDLWSIAATEERGVRVILPQGASPVVQYREKFDVYDNYECEIEPYPSIYEDFQINCYDWYDTGDDSNPSANVNVLTLEQVMSICEWISAQNEAENFPDIGERVVSLEVNPFVPQIRYVNPEENTVCYFITVRLRYVNRKAQRKSVCYEAAD